MTLVVNAGLGCTLPVRVNCPAEITHITLRKKNFKKMRNIACDIKIIPIFAS